MYKNKLTIPVFENVLMILLIAACVLLLLEVSYKSVSVPIDYDEAYNLQVVDLLAKGQGYASYGALKGSGPWLFDPHITTGPVILGPLALLWSPGGKNLVPVRIFMISFLWLYAIGLFYLLKKHKASLSLLALSISSSLCIIDMGAGRVLGELPAAAAIIWVAWALSTNKALVAALLAGLAIQIKMIYGLAGLVLLLFFFAFKFFSTEKKLLRTLILSGILFLLPTILFEIYRFITFGEFNSYLYSIDELKDFLRIQNINNFDGTWLNANSLGSKFLGLYQALPVYTWISIGIVIVLILLGSALQMTSSKFSKTNQESDDGPITALNQNDSLIWVVSASLIIAGLAMLYGWITQSAQLNPRQALPFMLLSIPAMFALGGGRYVELHKIFPSKKWDITLMVLLLVWVGFLIAALIIKFEIISQNKGQIEINAEQKRVVNVIKYLHPKSIYVDGWWQNPEYLLFSGVPGMPVKTGKYQIMVVQDYQMHLSNSSWDQYKQKCNKIFYSSSRTLVCQLPDFDHTDVDFQVLDWGPQSTKAGIVPNKQPDGGSGIWIKISKIDIEYSGPVKVYFSGKPANGVYFNPNGELITASIPPRFFKNSGRYAVTVKQIATGREFYIGLFIVD